MSRFLLGCDAGGTRVRAALADASSGALLAERVGEAAEEGGPEPALALWRALLDDRGAGRDEVAGLCAGIAKFTREGVAARWQEAAAESFPAAVVRIIPDYVIAFHGALPQGRGVVVVAGTGSVVYGEDGAGRSVRVGGRGWEFGDEGSGAHLSAELIRRTLRALDGLDPRTPLIEATVAFFGTDDPAELAQRARRRAAAETRGLLVPLALARARDGDRAARDLFVGAAGWLAAHARAAIVRLGLAPAEHIPVAMAGGLWEAGELLRDPFLRVLRRWVPGAEPTPPAGPPVQGALRCAAGKRTVH